MISPARAKFLKSTAAAQAAAVPVEETVMAGSTHELMLYSLANDRLTLKGVQSIANKCQLKADMVDKYLPYVQGVLEQRPGVRDDVVSTVMTWLIDAGRPEEAMPIAEYVIGTGMPMPDQFSRSAACLVAEEVADQVLNAIKQGQPGNADLMDTVSQITAGHDMPDQVKARVLKARALSIVCALEPLEEAGPGSLEALQEAMDYLKTAVSLHDKVGAVKDIERIGRALKRIGDASPE